MPLSLDQVAPSTLATCALTNQKVGLVAGWGSFPMEVAENCRALGNQVYIAAIKNHADSELKRYATDMHWFGVAKLGAQIRYFQKAGVQHVTLAGKLFKDRILFRGLGWIQHFPDTVCLQALYQNFITRTKDQRDDSILGAIVDMFAKKKITIVPATELAPQLLAQAGCLTHRKPNRRERLDLEFGWNIARQMGGLDIGQSITVRDQTVLGVEAIEGTDALITRTAQLCPRGGFTLIKVAKPRQDMRFDVPTIGLRTLQNLYHAGGRTVAIEANQTIIVDREQTLQFANTHGIAILSLQDAQAMGQELRVA